jgi:hypothetical protein
MEKTAKNNQENQKQELTSEEIQAQEEKEEAELRRVHEINRRNLAAIDLKLERMKSLKKGKGKLMAQQKKIRSRLKMLMKCTNVVITEAAVQSRNLPEVVMTRTTTHVTELLQVNGKDEESKSLVHPVQKREKRVVDASAALPRKGVVDARAALPKKRVQFRDKAEVGVRALFVENDPLPRSVASATVTNEAEVLLHRNVVNATETKEAEA